MADQKNSNEFFRSLRSEKTPHKSRKSIHSSNGNIAPNLSGTPNPYMRNNSALSGNLSNNKNKHSSLSSKQLQQFETY